MDDKTINVLRDIGLSKKEVDIYLACLELGKASVVQIAKKANTKRPTAYNVIECLLAKGMLSRFADEKGQKFSAEKPARLLTILQQKQSELTEVVPNLLAIAKTESDIKPEVKFYQGLEGLKAVYEDTLNYCEKGEEILNCLAVEGSYEVLPKYIFDYMGRRVAKGITMRAIGRDSEHIRKRKANDEKELRHIKIVNKNELPVSIEKNIYKDKVALMNFRGFPFGVIIKSSQIAKSEKAIFELLWKKLPG